MAAWLFTFASIASAQAVADPNLRVAELVGAEGAKLYFSNKTIQYGGRSWALEVSPTDDWSRV
jgi:hypothetical protein